MPKVILTKESRMADRIIRSLPQQKEVAKKLNISQQLVSYRIKNVYPTELVELIKLLDLAGYEVTEK